MRFLDRRLGPARTLNEGIQKRAKADRLTTGEALREDQAMFGLGPNILGTRYVALAPGAGGLIAVLRGPV